MTPRKYLEMIGGAAMGLLIVAAVFGSLWVITYYLPGREAVGLAGLGLTGYLLVRWAIDHVRRD
jgi:hypothetical protein